jgi:hypothetical protein
LRAQARDLQNKRDSGKEAAVLTGQLLCPATAEIWERGEGTSTHIFHRRKDKDDAKNFKAKGAA